MQIRIFIQVASRVQATKSREVDPGTAFIAIKIDRILHQAVARTIAAILLGNNKPTQMRNIAVLCGTVDGYGRLNLTSIS